MEENKQPSQRYLCNVKLGQFDITINGNAVATDRGLLIETKDIRGTVTDIGFANWKKHTEALGNNLVQFQALAPAGEGGAVFLDPEHRSTAITAMRFVNLLQKHSGGKYIHPD